MLEVGQTIQVSAGPTAEPFDCEVTTASARCRFCNALIAWVRTPARKSMTVDRKSVDDGDPYISHFATCPKASEARKR